ncbi:MAG: hypothetical protein AAFR10_21080 [Pseudomonadota bacterium]
MSATVADPCGVFEVIYFRCNYRRQLLDGDIPLTNSKNKARLSQNASSLEPRPLAERTLISGLGCEQTCCAHLRGYHVQQKVKAQPKTQFYLYFLWCKTSLNQCFSLIFELLAEFSLDFVARLLFTN